MGLSEGDVTLDDEVLICGCQFCRGDYGATENGIGFWTWGIVVFVMEGVREHSTWSSV